MLSPAFGLHETDAMRTEIVRTFMQAEGAYISGEALSQRFGVTRTAIWKHINTLESMGFAFASANRKGYKLLQTPDILLEPLLAPYLNETTKLGRTVHWLPSVDSTNIYAQTLVGQGAAHGTIVNAAVQTGGKGRRGRVWFSPKEGLWMSIILRHPLPLRRAAELTLLTSIGVRRAIMRLTGLPVSIKWPNDLLVHGKKICGVLAEIRADGENVQHAVVGMGINTNIPLEDYPDELKSIATSLFAESGQTVSHRQLAGQILNELDPLFTQLADGESGFKDVLDEWKAACSTLGQHVQVQTVQETLSGIAVDVDEAGVLYLQQENGQTIAIHSGDVLFGH